MKNVLLATTALVFSAGFAAAEVTVTGSANMGFKYNEAGLGYADGKDAAGWYEIDMDVTGTMEADSGLTFGANIELDSDYAALTDRQSLADVYECYLVEGFSDECAVGSNETLSASVFVSGSFGTITVGAIDPIAEDYGLQDIGFDGIGIDDIAEDAGYIGEADIRWDYATGDFTFGVSMHTIYEDYGLGIGYDQGAFNAALTYDHFEGGSDDVNTTSLLLGYEANGFAGHIYVTDATDNGTSYGIYGSYVTGPWLFEAAYAKADDDSITAPGVDAYGIGAKYDLGGGAKLAGGLGSVDSDMVADLGVTFSF
ncbi:porin [Sinirhodobacter sp. WL0062]|uniref:Porin n=1 Tax=Rhodobacter flavimaris TaxID=2907145 RepID=A0ABS8YXW6_9RHOB|nr:porin [Sinirhodobacter sp. WL0062]MCE5973286.1 porin [Sinirhodobacter sp. WL0062]